MKAEINLDDNRFKMMPNLKPEPVGPQDLNNLEDFHKESRQSTMVKSRKPAF